MNTIKATLFISRESAIYEFTRREIEAVCAGFGSDCRIDLEIVDIAERPELAQEYDIEVLPTLVVGRRRCVGPLTPEALKNCLGDLVSTIGD